MPCFRTAAALLLVVIACAPTAEESAPAGSAGSVEPVVTVDGSRTTVANPAIDADDMPELVEEASIGAATGTEAYLLGGVSSLVADDELIWVADHQTVNVRVYDRDGVHVRDIGAPGNGPGELRRPWAIGLDVEGRLVVRDQLQRRVHVFGREGELIDDWPSERGIRSTVGADGSVHVLREDVFPNADGVVTAQVMSHAPDGTPGPWRSFPDHAPTPAVDYPIDDPTGPPRQMRGRLELMAVFLGVGADWRSTRWVPFAPRVVHEVTAAGDLVSGRADGYRFLVQRRDRSELVVEKEWTPVAVHPDEADWHRRRVTALWRAATDPGWTWLGGEIPAHKGAYHAIVPGHDGSLWVIREGPGEPLEGCDENPEDYYGFEESPCWRQPYFADVFDEEGSHTGSVAMPDGISYHVRPFIDGNTVVALLEQDGVAYVKRFSVTARPE